jgi:hypothetical protein
MTEQPTAPKTPDHGGIGSLISLPAIIIAALVAATTALIRPYLETGTESTVLVAVFLSVGTTTSKSIYTACAGKITNITKGSGGRRWTLILIAGLLAGLAACLLGIGVTSGAQLAMGKEPSISPNGTEVIPISPPPAMSDPPALTSERAPLRKAPLRSASQRLALMRRAPLRKVPLRKVPLRKAPLRSASQRLTLMREAPPKLTTG